MAPVPETGRSSAGVEDMTPDTCLGGYLDPETGQWVMESSSKRSSRSSSPRREERGRTPDKRGLNNTQVCTRADPGSFIRFKSWKVRVGSGGDFSSVIKGKKANKVKDKRKEWNLAKEVWGGEEDVATPVKQKKGNKKKQSGGGNKENTPAPEVKGTRRSGRASRVNYQEMPEGSQSQ